MCLTHDGAGEVLGELEDRRMWDARWFAACGVKPAAKPTSVNPPWIIVGPGVPMAVLP